MLFNGIVLGSLAVDRRGEIVGQPQVTAPGLLQPEDPEAARIATDFAQGLRDLPSALRKDDASLQDAARATLRRALGRKLQKRPVVDVHLIRV
jgi:ribonuclease J